MAGRIWIWSLLLAVLVWVWPLRVCASEGDRDLRFSMCSSACSRLCDVSGAIGTSSLRVDETDPAWGDQWGYPFSQPPALTPVLQYTFWSCGENCGYLCMRRNVWERAHDGEPTVKYYGKWPFVRVWGIQELFSVLFSIANLIPHLQYLFVYRMRVPSAYWLRNFWSMYSIVACNTWLWSAVFHARDSVITERLDYFSASFTIVISIGVTILRIFQVRRRWAQAPIFVVLVGAFTCHVAYLQFVHFDYGWNMKVSLAAGLFYSSLWVVYALSTLRDRPYMRKALWATLLLWLAASLEVYDFPPFFDLLDAHAIWHGCTPAISYLFYSFLLDDARYELKLGHEASKRDPHREITPTTNGGTKAPTSVTNPMSGRIDIRLAPEVELAEGRADASHEKIS